jgi:hypothetical protein
MHSTSRSGWKARLGRVGRDDRARRPGRRNTGEARTGARVFEGSVSAIASPFFSSAPLGHCSRPLVFRRTHLRERQIPGCCASMATPWSALSRHSSKRSRPLRPVHCLSVRIFPTMQAVQCTCGDCGEACFHNAWSRKQKERSAHIVSGFRAIGTSGHYIRVVTALVDHTKRRT